MIRNKYPSDIFSSSGFDNIHPANDEVDLRGGDGGSGGGDDSMNIRITRLEVAAANQEKLIEDVRNEMRGVRGDIQGLERSSRSDAASLERRIVDKMDENHKWVIGLIISSILVPLLIALVTK